MPVAHTHLIKVAPPPPGSILLSLSPEEYICSPMKNDNIWHRIELEFLQIMTVPVGMISPRSSANLAQEGVQSPLKGR